MEENMRRKFVGQKPIVSRYVGITCLLLQLGHSAVFSKENNGKNFNTFEIDTNSKGILEKINNISNLTIVSHDENDFKAEYKAGFIQGKLQGKSIADARDNAWSASYLADPSHSFPKTRTPSKQELKATTKLLTKNYVAFIKFINDPKTDALTAHRLKRLLFRMLGIYHGAVLSKAKDLDFSGKWVPNLDYFNSDEIELKYNTDELTFMDVYYINAYPDLMDIIAYAPNLIANNQTSGSGADRCSAFLKRTTKDVLLAHNTWAVFLSQTMVQTVAVNKDILTINAFSPGLILSGTDFGYNNKGILFNETTINGTKNQIRPEGILTFWRAALAENFAASIDDFFDALALDNTGSYLNSYMIIDAKTNQTGFFEGSHRCLMFYRSTDAGKYSVKSKSLDGKPCATDYDTEMLTSKYIMGNNFPVSFQIRKDLEPIDNRPARKQQFKQFLPTVDSVESAKKLITYTDPHNPLSIFGRWDLGYGETNYPKQIPDGSIDAKVASTEMVREFMKLTGTLDLESKRTGFWMLFGTPHVNGEPFVWSQSSWKWQQLKDVPDRVDGSFTLVPLYLK
jgi:hypothetical protein